MTTYSPHGEILQDFIPTAQRIPVEGMEDMPVVTVQARFDWKFWAGVAVAGFAAYLLLKSMQRAARHG